MATQTHVIASSSNQPSNTTSGSNNVIGGRFKVGKKIGEGSFGVVFEGSFDLTDCGFFSRFSDSDLVRIGVHIDTSRRVAIKFVSQTVHLPFRR